MKTYKIKITDTYIYKVEVEAKNQQEALKKAEEYYKVATDGVTGVANALSHQGTKYEVDFIRNNVRE